MRDVTTVRDGPRRSWAWAWAVNVVLPFLNGLMLGFGELVAHELAWRWRGRFVMGARDSAGQVGRLSHMKVYPVERRLAGIV
ncbi:Mim1p KNAG_0L01030 [Huiozyma naganishii CBS 8797]|uniref:Mitochondrial import protein 1 n=1 Tax=Huiozyma naganishii (strain ATCC MYA-139 / BCRC 22969 / CBS 8797 / KCTC 17520 / NBRC 10181 / NCYC 3082 / Yp74L-3) TaxID=1071383 RepID=J7SAG2_HUIN7|nr:hypothetical protein KNAG_0L01030 [Kazachstania naganishii CBS 8797]CCK72724.1 hypothetical protein KNAG_0L01030 [Kazachstania naganishii CBS 8797]